MPELHPIDEHVIKPLVEDLGRWRKEASKSTIPPVGMERVSKREARQRLRSEWGTMSPDQRAQKIEQAGGVDAIMELLA